MKKMLIATLSAAALGLSATSTVMAANDVNRPAMNDGSRTGTNAPAANPETERSGSVGQYVDDATITFKVTADLARDDVTKARHIRVETVKGVVTLSGEVESQAQVNRAEIVARAVDGVSEVRNELTTTR